MGKCRIPKSQRHHYINVWQLMQTLEFRNDTLIEIGTFLARRWSENENITIEFSEKSEAKNQAFSGDRATREEK